MFPHSQVRTRSLITCVSVNHPVPRKEPARARGSCQLLSGDLWPRGLSVGRTSGPTCSYWSGTFLGDSRAMKPENPCWRTETCASLRGGCQCSLLSRCRRLVIRTELKAILVASEFVSCGAI